MFPGLLIFRMLPTSIFLASRLPLAAHCKPIDACQPDSFTFPNITGAALFGISAQHVSNYSGVSLLPGTDLIAKYTIDFCNVTVSYGHMGWNDTINVSVWLPLKDWNERLLGTGGGGYSGSFGAIYQTAAVDKGFVAIGTDAGHSASLELSTDASFWAITSPGNSNFYLLEDWGSRSLGELSVVGKHVSKEFYGRSPRSSYFTGCSGGGRQAFALAQRYPDAFDGLLASSPAISIESFVPAAYFAAQEMNTIGYYPSPCEVKALTQAAINACDTLDGVKDSIISNPQYCMFSAYDVVGQSYSCNGTEYVFTEEGARIVQAAWSGPNNGEISWYPYNKDADLAVSVIKTECESSQENCTRVTATKTPTGGTAKGDLFGSWIQYLVAKDPLFELSSMTMEDYYSYLRQSMAEWSQMLGAADPHLDPFHAAGGKIISWHGLADSTIQPRTSSAYYDQVLRLNDNTMDFFRHFEAPGVGHCYGGYGPLPNEALQSLISWVENGTAPDTLFASSAATGIERPLCPYPSRQIYTGGNVNSTTSFACAPIESM